MKTTLTILIVNYNSSEFIETSLYALSKLTKNNYKVLILDNNSKRTDYEKLKKIVSKYNNVLTERKETNLRGSVAHGTGLNYLFRKVNTPYFSILDADATWLIKDWDEILISKLDRKIPLIGTQAPPPKPQDFPVTFAILFETKTFKKLNIDFRPKDTAKLQDTGYELREKYLNAGFKGKTMQFRNTRTFKKGPFRELISAEYYLSGYDHIFTSHFGRGSTLGTQKFKNSKKKYIYKIPFLGGFLLKNKGKKDKQKWINICKKIVEEQAYESD